MIRVGVVGASGRTGALVVEELVGHPRFVLAAALVSPQSGLIGKATPAGGCSYSSDLNLLATCEAVIDFSTPEVSMQVVELCAKSGVPVLVATTGHSTEQVERLGVLAQQIPLALVPNTSIGAAVLAMASRYIKDLLGPGFDIEVSELHHRMKRDAPSGTARMVIDHLRDESSAVVFGREGVRRSEEIGVVSLRGGDVAGEHTVYFLGQGERLELTQRASTRAVFATGAIKLMERLLGCPKGMYGPRELILSTGAQQ